MKKILTFAAVSTFVVLGAGFFVQGASACFCEIPECNCCSNCGCQIPGCTDPDALNYDPCATVDDGSCEYEAPERYSIFGKKFNDENGNGVYEQGEPGLAGWTITIDNGACFEESTITDSEGNYSFSSLNPGTYTVCELEEEGWIQTYPNSAYGCYAVELADADIYGIDFGNYQEPAQPFIIKAYKVVCDKEEDLPNWTDSGAPSIIEQGTAQDYVDQSQGACHLEADWAFQWGYSDAPKLSGDYVGQAPIGTGYSEWKNFDSSTAGSGEPAIVQIDDLQSSPKIWVREVLKQGYVPFTNPPKGVKEDNVSAEMYCHNDILNYDNYDYIINPELGQTYYCVAFNALIEQEVLGCTDPDALNYNPDATLDDGSCQYDEPDKYSIFGLKFSDQNNNGANDSEPGLAGWTIVLTDTDSLNSTTVTDTEGNYSFLNLYPGTYTVCEEQQQGWIQTYPSGTQACHIVELTDSDASGIDFGNYQETVEILGCTDPDALNYNPDATLDDGSCQYDEPDKYSIFGLKFSDQNNNGANDSEPGLAGWTIVLTDTDSLNSTTVTDTEGNYSFLNLYPGTYTVCEEQQQGWIQTYPSGTQACHIVELTDSDASGIDFGNYQETVEILGCTDPDALNYNPDATLDDGSCQYEIPGCMDPSANNYNPQATVSNGSCTYGGGGSVRPRFNISKTVEQDFVNPGGEAAYTIVVECLGSGVARNTVLTDDLPEGFVYQGEADGTWELGDMQRGDKETITYEVLVSEDAEPGFYENTAKVQAQNSDQFKAKAEIEVRNPEVKGKETFAELQIEKTVDKSSAKAGSYVIFTVKIKNNGSADAINVVVEDKLPSGFITDEGKKEISWEIDIIEKGETWQDSFRAYIDSDTPDGSYENEATAFAENYPDEVEDTAVVVLGVLPHTGEGLFDSALFYLVFIVLVVACFELLRTVVKTRLAKVIVFSLVAFACLMVLTYPFWPMAEYAVCDWVKTEIQSEEKPAEDTPLSASSALRADLQGNYLVISKIGVEIPIVQGQDESALEKGAWLIPQTSTPDLMKNTALAAHRFKYKPPHKETFYLLDKVSKGDKILVLWEGKEYYYTVNSVSVVDPAYVEVLKETENPTLTLITCHPLFSDKSRLVVQAELEL